MRAYTNGHEVDLEDVDLKPGSMYEYVGTLNELLELSKTTSVYILRYKSTECFFPKHDKDRKFAIVKDGHATPYMYIVDVMRAEMDSGRAIPEFVIDDSDDN